MENGKLKEFFNGKLKMEDFINGVESLLSWEMKAKDSMNEICLIEYEK